MLFWRRLGWVGLGLVLAVGCTSKSQPAVMDDGSPTADSGYIQQGTTGGDAADTFNIRNHVGADGASPAILMSPPDAGLPSQVGVSAAPASVAQSRAGIIVAKPASAASAVGGKPAASGAKSASAKTAGKAAKTGGSASSSIKPAAKPTGTKI